MNHKVAFIYAHPDDETFGNSFLIRQLADAGEESVLFTATRGEAGKTGHLGNMSREELALRREAELAKALHILGISAYELHDYGDGKLSQLDQVQLENVIAEFLNRHQPSVVVTFPEDGLSGHLDHIAIHHAVNRIVFSQRCPSVQKMYYNILDTSKYREQSVMMIEPGNMGDMKRRRCLRMNRRFSQLRRRSARSKKAVIVLPRRNMCWCGREDRCILPASRRSQCLMGWCDLA